jgi:hypothetical protein
MALRRMRGVVLRLVRQRRASILAGVALAAPALWIELGSLSDAWWVDGLCLIFLATGIALVWTGLTGVSPDWVDDGER